MFENIEAIFFDMNGTLRTRELPQAVKPQAGLLPAVQPQAVQPAALKRILTLLGKDGVPDSFWEELSRRFDAYGVWAQGRRLQLSESEIWTRWLLPDEPPGPVAANAAELMLAWMERKGVAAAKPGAQQILHELKRRGYRLGIISNTMSTLDLPRFIDAVGWNPYFDAVILSSDLKSRKPAPDLFVKAAQSIHLDPVYCAYVGNRIAKDMVGCKGAGYGLGILIETAGPPRPDEQNQTVQPDITIHSLGELLDIFTAKQAQPA